jgi:hypothetical protein
LVIAMNTSVFVVFTLEFANKTAVITCPSKLC